MERGSRRRRVWVAVFAVVVIRLLALTWLKWGALLDARVVREIEAGPLTVRDALGEAVLATLLTYEQCGGAGAAPVAAGNTWWSCNSTECLMPPISGASSSIART